MNRQTQEVDFPWAAGLSAEEQGNLAQWWLEARQKPPEPGAGVVLRRREAARLLGLRPTRSR